MLVLGLTLAVLKDRFGAHLRTSFLEDIGQDKEKFPIRTPEGLKYLKEVKKEKKVYVRSTCFYYCSNIINSMSYNISRK